MEARAVAKFIRVSSRKARLVADAVRGSNVNEAMAILNAMNKKAARVISHVLKSAIANARQKELNIDIMNIKELMVDKGPYLRRFRPRAMGRATMIRKPMSHITIVVDEDIVKKQRLEKIKLENQKKSSKKTKKTKIRKKK